jgi:transposase InsO family protein
VPSGGSALQPSGGLAELGGLSWAATTLSEHVSTYRQTLGAQLDQPAAGRPLPYPMICRARASSSTRRTVSPRLLITWERLLSRSRRLGHKVYPYLLRGKTIDRANQVWAADITYIPASSILIKARNSPAMSSPRC